MRRAVKTWLCIVLAIALSLSAAIPAFAGNGSALDKAIAETAAYVQEAVPYPQVGSIGGEWAVIALKRSGEAISDAYFDGYYTAVLSAVKANSGVLSATKYTEYSRVILALASMGRYAADVGGYDLLTPLGDYDKTIKQGLTGPTYALLALDSLGYAMPENETAKTQATREKYISYLLSRQLQDGGWSLGGEDADPDTTAMVLQALANYQSDAKAAAAARKAVARLSALQNAEGGYSSWGTENCESISQILIALSALGISTDDSRFIKNGYSLVDALLSYAKNGGFSHVPGGEVNEMATEQALCALAAVKRQRDAQNCLFNMMDALPKVAVPVVTIPGKTFSDIAGLDNETAIEALAARGILGGMGNGLFEPDRTMTRAEFAAVVTHSLGLEAKATDAFSDVPASAWYSGAVGTAYRYGILSGVGGGKFNPSGTVTCGQAAQIAEKAAKLCGPDTPADDLTEQPDMPILRCEAAQLLYDMLRSAKLL